MTNTDSQFITARDLADKLSIELRTVQARARKLEIALRGGRYIFTEAEAERIAACDPKPGPKRNRPALTGQPIESRAHAVQAVPRLR